MNYPETEYIEIERDKSWITLWFNQPEKRNPMTDGAVAELMAVFRLLREDITVRGVTLRGRGGIFCAGGDLKSFQNDFQNGASHGEVMAMSRGVAAFLDAFNSLPQVTISVVEGAALAGGFGLVCCSDVVICHAEAKFAMTETMIGLSPAQISPFVIQRLGFATARRLMLTAARFTGAESAELGLSDFVGASADELLKYEAQIKSQVLRCAPGAVAATKALLIALPQLPRDVAIEEAAENFAARLRSDEAKDGIASFFEKRKPNWAE